jgi:hypothetical protein
MIPSFIATAGPFVGYGFVVVTLFVALIAFPVSFFVWLRAINKQDVPQVRKKPQGKGGHHNGHH